jgi:hypothetical protein
MVTQLKFSAEYVDKLSPVDRRLYIMYYQRDQEEERKKQKPTSGISMTNNIPADIGV